MIIAERIARVLTEHYLVENDLDDDLGEASFDRMVDRHWPAHLKLARDVLRAIRLPDAAVSSALAETGAWESAIDDALAEADEAPVRTH